MAPPRGHYFSARVSFKSGDCSMPIADCAACATRSADRLTTLGKLQELSRPVDLSCARFMPMVREGCGFFEARDRQTDAELLSSTATAISWGSRWDPRCPAGWTI